MRIFRQTPHRIAAAEAQHGLRNVRQAERNRSETSDGCEQRGIFFAGLADENRQACRRLVAFDAHVVLDADRQSVKRANYRRFIELFGPILNLKKIEFLTGFQHFRLKMSNVSNLGFLNEFSDAVELLGDLESLE